MGIFDWLTGGGGKGESFTDPRDGQKYRTVKIGEQTWMAENLNFKVENSWYYDGDESNGKRYGRLYAWDAAKVAIPAGWHLPSRGEWDALIKAAGGEDAAGKGLKSKHGWSGGGDKGKGKDQGKNKGKDKDKDKAVDKSGFAALPGGFRSGDGFSHAGEYGHWWSATEYSEGYAYSRLMDRGDDGVREFSDAKGNGYSVRCIKD